MSTFKDRLFICGVEQVARYQSRRITHVVSVANPGSSSALPAWFRGAHLLLWFGDVVSESDARQWETRAPAIEDIRRGLVFFRRAWQADESRVLVHCNHGASRSPALAYVFVADLLGAGREAEALQTVLEIRPEAIPNSLVVQLGDTFLARNGALLQPLRELYLKINDEMGKLEGMTFPSR